MRRVPIPLILAAVIAVGVTVMIIFQITVLTPPSAVVVLVPQGSTSATFSFQTVNRANVAFPIGIGMMQINHNTTALYYYNVTDLWAIAVPASRYNNMTGQYSVPYTTIQVFDCGNVVVVGSSSTVYVGQWADFGGFKVTVPVNFTASRNQLACIRKYLSRFSIASVAVFNPRIDYYSYDGTYINIYYDYVDTSSYTLRYGYYSYTPAALSNNAVIGYKIIDPQTGIVFLGGYYVGAFSATSSGKYAVTVTGK